MVFAESRIDRGTGLTDMISRVSRFAAPLILLAPVLAGVLFVTPAAAAFAVCNKTDRAASVAIGYFDGKEWGSAGWWQIAAGDCMQLISEPLVARYFYLYAFQEEIGGAWDGDRTFCVRNGRFTIRGRVDCLKQGYEVKRFFQVDTGNAPNWTENLAD